MTALAAPAAPGPRLAVRSGSATRVLMTLDAVGGVWRYAMDAAAGLARHGVEIVFAGLGPKPDLARRREAARLGELVWLDAPLDWTVGDEASLGAVPGLIAGLARARAVDLVHLNLPSQACDLDAGVPVVVVSHSCVVTWFHAVRGRPPPPGWQWHVLRNRAGFDAADAVLAPSRSHADMLRRCYGPIGDLSVIHNATQAYFPAAVKEDFVFAAGRWWDEGKNGAVLDRAARLSDWPVVMAGPVLGPNGQYVGLTHADRRGELGNAEVRDLMSHAGIVVSPSLYEPFGLAALEGARAGAALVLADIPTYRELWDGAALFAQPDDPEAFARAINRLAGDKALRRDFARRAAIRARDFSVEAQAAALADLYASVLAAERQTVSVAG